VKNILTLTLTSVVQGETCAFVFGSSFRAFEGRHNEPPSSGQLFPQNHVTDQLFTENKLIATMVPTEFAL
jgi:hypothetical protein